MTSGYDWLYGNPYANDGDTRSTASEIRVDSELFEQLRKQAGIKSEKPRVPVKAIAIENCPRCDGELTHTEPNTQGVFRNETFELWHKVCYQFVEATSLPSMPQAT